LRDRIPGTAPERSFFDSDGELKRAFPDGRFNCWGLMNRAKARFRETNVGDLVLMVPWVGIHGGGIHQLGVVKAKCPTRCYEATRILWPNIGDPRRLYPFLFFFDTEVGDRSWVKFIEDMQYDERYNPRGHYIRIDASRFDRWSGAEGYLDFLRSKCGFKRLVHESQTRESEVVDNIAALEAVRAEEEARAFDPTDIEDARRRILSAIVLRQGRQVFRENVLNAYERACAVTGCEVTETLEAAHIVAYRGPETNHTSNGILLRSDIHILFDIGLIAIDPENYCVVISNRLMSTSYEELSGKRIRLPARTGDQPNTEALKFRMVEFSSRESVS
jgi:hypothetical protein